MANSHFCKHPRFPSPLLILLLFPVNINECRVLQVSLALRFKFKTDLIINWICPIKSTHGERLGASLQSLGNGISETLNLKISSGLRPSLSARPNQKVIPMALLLMSVHNICVFLFVNCVFIFRIANTFVASYAMKYSEIFFVIRKFCPTPPNYTC